MGTVLVIDDHADTLFALQKIIKRFGYRVLTATTGEEGLAVLATETPDLVIVDGMMPGMNGPEFIRLCRAHPETATIPIILNTAIGDHLFTDDAIKKGANEVWVKGQVEMEQMRERLAHYLRRGQDNAI